MTTPAAGCAPAASSRHPLRGQLTQPVNDTRASSPAFHPTPVRSRLRALCNAPLDSPWAFPLSIAVGSAVGAIVAALYSVFNPDASVAQGGTVGVCLTSLYMARQVRDHQAAQQNDARRAFLTRHPEVAQAVRESGITAGNDHWTQLQYDALQAGIEVGLRGLRVACAHADVPVSPQLESALAVFYIRHCAETGLFILSNSKRRECYVASIEPVDGNALARRVEAGEAPGAVLRNARVPFMRADHVNDALRHRQTFTLQAPDHESRVVPALEVASALCTAAPQRVVGADAGVGGHVPPTDAVQVVRRRRTAGKTLAEGVPGVRQEKAKPALTPLPVVWGGIATTPVTSISREHGGATAGGCCTDATAQGMNW